MPRTYCKMDGRPTVIGTEAILDTRWLGVWRDRIRYGSDPAEHEFYLVRCPDYAQVVAITPTFELLLVEQYRHGIGQTTLELPAGMIEADEPPEATAKRELQEETGGSTDHWTALGGLRLNGSRMKSTAFGFLATDVTLTHATDHEATESIQIHSVPLQKTTRIVQEGRISDMGSVAFLGLARLARPDLPWE